MLSLCPELSQCILLIALSRATGEPGAPSREENVAYRRNERKILLLGL